MKKILFAFLTLVIFTAVGCTTQIDSDSSSTVTPKKGLVISLQDCKADPYILQVKNGTEVTFKNLDNVSRTIFIDNQELKVEAQGEVKYIAKSSFPAPFTNNYLCDDQSLPKGGAIYIE